MFLMRSFTRLGSSMPGSCTRIRSLPWRAISGSRHAELVDAVADRLEGLRDGVVLDQPAGRVLQREDPLSSRRSCTSSPAGNALRCLRAWRGPSAGDRHGEGGVRRQLDGAEAGVLASRLSVSVASSRSAFTASAVLTCRTRWMPPRRSSPSLMAFFRASFRVGDARARSIPSSRAVARPDVAGDGAHHHQQDQEDSPAKLLPQISSRKKRTAQCTGRASGFSFPGGGSTPPTGEGTALLRRLPSKSLSCL